MGANTKIQWTWRVLPDGRVIKGYTFNAWQGCVKVDAGCKNCYAEAFNHRIGREIWGKNAPRTLASEEYMRLPYKWNEEAKREGYKRLVFSASMSDVFENYEPNPMLLTIARVKLWGIIQDTPNLIYILVTKRPENIMSMVPEVWRSGFPLNVWVLTSVSDQESADKRIPIILNIPAKVRGISAEPLLDSIYLIDYLSMNGMVFHRGGYTRQLDWVIVGGESGAGAREMKVKYATDIIDSCKMANVPVFFKQFGTTTAKKFGMAHKKGEDMSEWAAYFQRARETPVIID